MRRRKRGRKDETVCVFRKEKEEEDKSNWISGVFLAEDEGT